MGQQPGVIVQYDELGDMEYLARGGQATVHRLTHFRLPDVPGELVLKKYKKGQAPPHGLDSIVKVRSRLDEAPRAKLDMLAAWPARVVLDGSELIGVLTPLIPASYFEQLRLPSGKTESNPRELQYLFIDEAQAAKLGVTPPSLVERFAVLRDLAFALGMLHKRGVIFGDVNAKNALYRTSAGPTVMLVDCDAVRIRGSAAVVKQYHSPDWDPPEGGGQTFASDLYKLGLLVLRILSPAAFTSISRDPSRADACLDADGRALLRRALASDSTARPTAKEWYVYLRGATSGRPVVVAAAPATSSQGPRTTPSHGGWTRGPDGAWVKR